MEFLIIIFETLHNFIMCGVLLPYFQFILFIVIWRRRLTQGRH